MAPMREWLDPNGLHSIVVEQMCGKQCDDEQCQRGRWDPLTIREWCQEDDAMVINPDGLNWIRASAIQQESSGWRPPRL